MTVTPRESHPENYSLTLDRGLRLLRVLAQEPEGLTVSELADELDTHRAGIYRLLGPLTAHRLVVRGADGRHTLGLGLLELASAVRSRLQEVAVRELRILADELRATTALTIRDGDEAVVAAVVEPSGTAMHIAYRPGLRHPVDRAAPGLAILAGEAPLPGERPEVAVAREQGWAVTTGELLPGATGVGRADPRSGTRDGGAASAPSGSTRATRPRWPGPSSGRRGRSRLRSERVVYDPAHDAACPVEGHRRPRELPESRRAARPHPGRSVVLLQAAVVGGAADGDPVVRPRGTELLAFEGEIAVDHRAAGARRHARARPRARRLDRPGERLRRLRPALGRPRLERARQGARRLHADRPLRARSARSIPTR